MPTPRLLSREEAYLSLGLASALETQTLTITASFLSPDAPKKGIPSGLLAYVTLKISETGRPASITMRPTVEAGELGTNQPVQNLRGVRGQGGRFGSWHTAVDQLLLFHPLVLRNTNMGAATTLSLSFR